jgi:hypothetical protein
MVLGLEQGLGHVFDYALACQCGFHQRSCAHGLLQLTKLHPRRVVVLEKVDNVVVVLDEIMKVVE